MNTFYQAHICKQFFRRACNRSCIPQFMWAVPEPCTTPVQWCWGKIYVGNVLHEEWLSSMLHQLTYAQLSSHRKSILQIVAGVHCWVHHGLLPEEWGSDFTDWTQDFKVLLGVLDHRQVCWWLLWSCWSCTLLQRGPHCPQILSRAQPQDPGPCGMPHFWMTLRWGSKTMVRCSNLMQ